MSSLRSTVSVLHPEIMMDFFIVALLSSLPAVGVTVTVTVGDNAILPCYLEPPFNVRTLTVEWKRDGQSIHVWRQGKDYLDPQDENFRGRTSVFHEEMIRGNISLKLTNVTELDAGSYTCNVPKLQSQVRRGFINLTVEPVENGNKESQTGDINTEPGKCCLYCSPQCTQISLLFLSSLQYEPENEHNMTSLTSKVIRAILNVMLHLTGCHSNK
ncbi:V-set domain-containing T-cell activation inhibitor 1-like [Dicentrarchus labrax]|uniref:Ig-like domain-containing protein n=1 Tax=Dicentrarchus labrax TaxID=13489 RepID=A0A8P4KEC1_DICLA|nr:V-set domain-containing T-cell activation inhibitor 1-like [Dicentrarchus labrax]